MKLELQTLNDLPGYKPPAFSLPTIMIDHKRNECVSWMAIIFVIGYWSYGLRIYWIK